MNVDEMKKQIQEAFDKENGARRLVLCCSCSNQGKKAVEAFSMLFPDASTPDVVKGRDRIYKLSQEIGNEHIKAISKLTGRYAYYVELDKNGIIIKEIDLITGKQLA